MSLGLWTSLLSYGVAVPLGIAKAVRAGSRFDLVTSVVVLVQLPAVRYRCWAWRCCWSSPAGSCSGFRCAGWSRRDRKGYVLGCQSDGLPLAHRHAGHSHGDEQLCHHRDAHQKFFLEEIRKQYVLTARAKGLPERKVLWKHVMRNALIPIVTGFPAAFIGAFFTGSLLIETQFSLDGLGLLSSSVIRRDYPVVMGTLYLFTLIGFVTKLDLDLCYAWVDSAYYL